MNAFSAHAGLRNAALFGEDGALVSDYCGASGLTAAEFGELVTGIRDVADDATRRMDTCMKCPRAASNPHHTKMG